MHILHVRIRHFVKKISTDDNMIMQAMDLVDYVTLQKSQINQF
jgi:hypothetical protein